MDTMTISKPNSLNNIPCCSDDVNALNMFAEERFTDFSTAESVPKNISVEDELKLCKLKWEEAEKQCECLRKENDRINVNLAQETHKSYKLEKKLQFIKDNQEIFVKLKEAYLNLKYNEATGQKMVSMTEKGVQTYKGILCCNCIEAEKFRETMVKMKSQYTDSVVMPKNIFDRIQATLSVLRATIEKRENSWSLNLGRESKFKVNIHRLKDENEVLRSLLKRRSENKRIDLMNVFEPPKNNDIGILKKIIVKFERRFRGKCNKYNKSSLYPQFNDSEKLKIEQLMSKYYNKLYKKEECRSSSSEKVCSHRSKSSIRNNYREFEKSSKEFFVNPLKLVDILLECKYIK